MDACSGGGRAPPPHDVEVGHPGDRDRLTIQGRPVAQASFTRRSASTLRQASESAARTASPRVALMEYSRDSRPSSPPLTTSTTSSVTRSSEDPPVQDETVLGALGRTQSRPGGVQGTGRLHANPHRVDLRPLVPAEPPLRRLPQADALVPGTHALLSLLGVSDLRSAATGPARHSQSA